MARLEGRRRHGGCHASEAGPLQPGRCRRRTPQAPAHQGRSSRRSVSAGGGSCGERTTRRSGDPCEPTGARTSNRDGTGRGCASAVRLRWRDESSHLRWGHGWWVEAARVAQAGVPFDRCRRDRAHRRRVGEEGRFPLRVNQACLHPLGAVRRPPRRGTGGNAVMRRRSLAAAAAGAHGAACLRRRRRCTATAGRGRCHLEGGQIEGEQGRDEATEPSRRPVEETGDGEERHGSSAGDGTR